MPFVPTGKVRTVIGTSHLDVNRLFTFGDVDGEGYTPRFQHCIGIAYYKGKLYVADTYNNKIKVVDAEKASSRTLAGNGRPGDSDDPAEFDEPAGLSAAAGKLYVADTNNNRIRIIELDDGNRVSTLEIKGLAPLRPEDTTQAERGQQALRTFRWPWAPAIDNRSITLARAVPHAFTGGFFRRRDILRRFARGDKIVGRAGICRGRTAQLKPA